LGIEEKPQHKVLCNAGIYMINPEVLHMIPKDVEFHMTDLIKEVTRMGLPITTFPIHEQWIDIGQAEHLKMAQREIKDF
jgi:NDP-sugar pyrophosphorylase family protein